MSSSKRSAKPSKKPAAKKPAAKKPVAKKAAAKKAAPKKPVAKKPAAKKPVAKKAATKQPVVKKPAPKKAVAKKTAAPKASPSKPAGKSAAAKKPAAKKAPARRDGTGHLDAKYARDLRAKAGHDEAPGRAFISKSRSGDDLAEELAEEAVETMTSGEDDSERLQYAEVDEERGGPFVISTAGQEFASGRDASNPRGTKREPFPRT